MTVSIALSCAKASNVAAKRSCPAPSHVDKPITEPESFKLHWLIEEAFEVCGARSTIEKMAPLYSLGSGAYRRSTIAVLCRGLFRQDPCILGPRQPLIGMVGHPA